jgi:hypothetical protein
MKKSFEEKIDLIDNLEVTMDFMCPIVQLVCMCFVVFICENNKIDICVTCFQLFLLGVQFLLPKYLRRFVMKKQREELIKKIEDSVNLQSKEYEM